MQMQRHAEHFKAAASEDLHKTRDDKVEAFKQLFVPTSRWKQEVQHKIACGTASLVREAKREARRRTC